MSTPPEHLAVRDWGNAAQAAAEEHIAAVWDFHFASEEAADADELEALGDDPAYGAFCGCQTCEVREILLAAVPVLAEAIVSGEVDPRLLLAATEGL